MKKLFSLIALIAMASTSFAQPGNETAASDTTEIKIGKRKIIVLSNGDEDKEEVILMDSDGEMITHTDDHDHDGDDEDKKRSNVDVSFLNLDLGMNYLTEGGSFGVSNANSMLESKPLNSTHVGIHLFTTRVNLIRHKVNLVTALTFDNNRFAFRDNIIVVPDQETLTLVEDTVNNYRKSKLISWYAQVPLMLNFQTSPDNDKRNFHLSVGGYAGLLLGAKTKRKGSEFGKVNQQDDFNLNPIRYGVTGRIGYRNLEFYCNYNLTSMFDEDQGPEIMPVTFGISLSGMM